MCPDDKDHACGQRNSGKQGEPQREGGSQRVENGLGKMGVFEKWENGDLPVLRER